MVIFHSYVSLPEGTQTGWCVFSYILIGKRWFKHKNVGWVLPKLNNSTNLETSFPVDVPSTNLMIFIYIYISGIFQWCATRICEINPSNRSDCIKKATRWRQVWPMPIACTESRSVNTFMQPLHANLGSGMSPTHCWFFWVVALCTQYTLRWEFPFKGYGATCGAVI